MSTDNDDISRLYQQTKDQEPPTQIDNAILSAAKGAVSGQALSEPQESSDKEPVNNGPFSGGLPAALTMAAVLVIAVILTPTIQQEEPAHVTSEKLNDMQLMEQESTDQLNNLKSEQRTISIQSKSEEKKGKTLATRGTSTPNTTGSTAYERKRMPAAEIYTYEEKDTAKERKTNGFNNLLSIQKNKPAAAPAQPPENTLDQMTSDEFMADDILSDTLSPQAWLKKIKGLIKQGDIKLAKQEYDAYKLEYPDEKIEQSILDSFNSSPD